MHSFPGGSALKDYVHSHGDLESLCWDRVACVVGDFISTPLGKTFIGPRCFSCFFGVFGPFFDHATSIIFTWHRCRELFRAHYDRHDAPIILQSKIWCSEMSASVETMKEMSKKTDFSLFCYLFNTPKPQNPFSFMKVRLINSFPLN